MVQQAIPVLAKLAGMIGDPAVRHRGTIGGSIANNDPNADYPAACLGLGATIITNKRRIKADDFFSGMFSTVLEPSEIITKVSFPVPKKAAYQKFRNQASRFALVGVFVAKRGSEIRVAVTGAGSNGVFRVPSFEEALKKRFSPKSLEGLTIPADGMNADIHGSAEYRAHLVGVLARRRSRRRSGSNLVAPRRNINGTRFTSRAVCFTENAAENFKLASGPTPPADRADRADWCTSASRRPRASATSPWAGPSRARRRCRRGRADRAPR